MKKYDISFLFPAIRTVRWLKLYESLQRSCKNYSWEAVFCGPFDLPESLRGKDNIKYIKDYGQVSRAVQVGALHAEGELIFIGNDDTTYFEDAFDKSIDLYKQKDGYKDIVQCTYTEGGESWPNEYWTPGWHDAFKLGGIDQSWKLATEPIINKDYFFELGGFDCRWEYMDGSTHDFMFRAQRNGSEIFYSPVTVGAMTHFPNREGDHAPIHDAMEFHDNKIFKEVWGEPNNRLKIDYNNWKEVPEIWERRFWRKKYTSYEEMWFEEGYSGGATGFLGL